MSKITKYEIDMLDVKAADAFLIHAYIDNGDGGAIYNHVNQYYD